MQIKTYTGRNATAVLAKIKAELGPDAVILSSRECSEGGRTWHEMSVGVEHAATPGVAGRAGFASSGGPGGPGGPVPPGWEEWHREWSQMKEHLFALMKPALRMEDLTPRQRVALEYLMREGVDDGVAMTLHRRLAADSGASVLEALADIVPVRGWGLAAWPQRAHVFAGPFGAGKTTAMLRMALALRREKPDLKIVLVNADCGRGHGRLLLKHYAELSSLVYREASTAAEFSAILRECPDAGRILVDLPGVARDGSLARQLAILGLSGAGAGNGVAVHLVLPPHHGPAQMTALLARYAFEGAGSLVWTKLDEACTFGALVNVAAACGLPVSALSYGPGMRNSLAAASDAALWRLLFKRQLPGEAPAQAEPRPAARAAVQTGGQTVGQTVGQTGIRPGGLRSEGIRPDGISADIRSSVGARP
ncbi:flagellar biosynthesis protein FlhF [Desulfovibrio oxamicus]|uniref:Flagellar biosynthesis protein FlhF n=1 Tax=Nitratidesulfovibrio oxamicus TaxID=32016 RepID=A0ABS0J0H5_9BACT|nr:flagellar biosynthesis protein FlhF [Nitratidesulfovibrio oxamicus]MBG3875921.1 flagellar biosynthesis protein FlhF [Nitratidesulfovibrio oxamicus]